MEPSGDATSVGGTDAVEIRHRAVLRKFIVRARRVEEHSLAADKEMLMAWARGTFTLKFEPRSGKATMTWDLPEEEALDSSPLDADRSFFKAIRFTIQRLPALLATSFVPLQRNSRANSKRSAQVGDRWTRVIGELSATSREPDRLRSHWAALCQTKS